MPNPPVFFAAFRQPDDDNATDPWHDLVAAVVAVKGSPRVCPPAAMLAGVERKLAFVTARAAWWAAPRVLGGCAAALAVTLGWLAWRASAPRDGGTLVATTVSASAKHEAIDAARASHAGDVGPSVVAKANPSGSAQQPGTNVAAGTAAASPTPLAPAPLKQQVAAIAATELATNRATRGGNGTLPAALSRNNETSPEAQSFGRFNGTDQIELKSDFYVVGMIAAALQDPVSANPYESVAQPLEWTDWRSGYEFGVELPPSETLALSATWTWKDPRNQSLVTGASSDGIGASASIVPPVPVAGSEARTQVPPAADEPKP